MAPRKASILSYCKQFFCVFICLVVGDLQLEFGADDPGAAQGYSDY